jgi:hypothetical protein
MGCKTPQPGPVSLGVAIRLDGTIWRVSHRCPGKVFAMQAITLSNIPHTVMRSSCAGAALDPLLWNIMIPPLLEYHDS